MINYKDLDVLQNTLIDYFKDRTLLTRDLLRQESLLKKIKNTFERYLIKHTIEVLKLRRYFKESLHKYYKKHVYFWWNNLFKDLTKLSENIKKLKQLYRSSKEEFVTSNARKKKFAIDNANDKKIKIDNASDKKIVTNNKRNKKKKTTNNLNLEEWIVTLNAKRRRFCENIYNLRRKILLSHFLLQSFANFI